MIREAIAKWLCPKAFEEREMLWRVWNRVTDLDRWCAEFVILDEALAWALERRDWRSYEDISELRERLRKIKTPTQSAPDYSAWGKTR